MTISTLTNHYLFQKQSGEIQLGTDTLVFIFMSSGFVFDRDVHKTYGDVAASRMLDIFSYPEEGYELTLQSHEEDNINDRARATFDDLYVTMSGGDLNPTPGAIIYDSTTTDNTVVGYIDFEADLVILDGETYKFQNLVFDDV